MLKMSVSEDIWASGVAQGEQTVTPCICWLDVCYLLWCNRTKPYPECDLMLIITSHQWVTKNK